MSDESNKTKQSKTEIEEEAEFRTTVLLGLDRIEKQNRMVDFRPLSNKKVLLVAGDILTGGTMKFVMNLVSEANVSEIKTACLVKGVTSALHPDYYGKEIPADFKMPWMFKGFGYARDSRKPKNY